MPIAPIPASSILVRAYNPSLALILASFFALSIRFFILGFQKRERGFPVTAFRVVAGTAFLVLGWLYTLFAIPQIVWDRPARIAAAFPAAGILLWLWLRTPRQGEQQATNPAFKRLIAGLSYFIFFAVLVLTATLTILRAGYIALIGDRVTLLVNVTGETQTRILSFSPVDRNRNPCQELSAGGARQNSVIWSYGQMAPQKSFTLHHVIISLPTGETAADLWIIGDEVAVVGNAVRFSLTLHSLDLPNLYALRYVCNGSSKSEAPDTYMPQVTEIPSTGTLKVHPWWRGLQNRLLNYWARHLPGGSSLAVQISNDESPYYPLVDDADKPIHKIFLLVLRPSAVATSRGSSPLEGKQSPFK